MNLTEAPSIAHRQLCRVEPAHDRERNQDATGSLLPRDIPLRPVPFPKGGLMYPPAFEYLAPASLDEALATRVWAAIKEARG